MRPIDADALKVHVCNMCDDGQRECKGDESCAILCWINEMPTIEAEPVRHGRWIPAKDVKKWVSSDKFVLCTECEKLNSRKSNFCPNCGAKMDGGVENAGSKTD